MHKVGHKILSSQGQLGQVWLSGSQFAHNILELQKHKIHAVCSAVDFNFTYPKQFNNLVLNLSDSSDQDLAGQFEKVCLFIQDNRKVTNVLIHCSAGISRSSALLISYMMNKYDKDYDTCLRILRKQRPCCQPNPGFEIQLRNYQRKLGIQNLSD